MLELTKETFEAEVLQAEGKVFVDFYGDGCVPCEALKPFIHDCADKYEGSLKFTALNTTKARRLAISQKVLGLPVMAVYENGAKIEELVKDDATEANIAAMIKRHVGQV
ncbi:MAG: thioredoxin family protein [Peptococcaceae bacterium]|jgi:thioredoxin 1|nr:thioredoxin family protein [Peptococcaceae bacterium]